MTPEKIAEAIPCGPDRERHLAPIRELIDAGFDEILISQVGSDQARFLEFFDKELRPRL